MNGELSIKVIASIQRLFCQITPERRGPGQAGSAGGKMHRGKARVTPHDRCEVLRDSDEAGPAGTEFDSDRKSVV